jgi:hypothetical protein
VKCQQQSSNSMQHSTCEHRCIVTDTPRLAPAGINTLREAANSMDRTCKQQLMHAVLYMRLLAAVVLLGGPLTQQGEHRLVHGHLAR